MSKDQLPVKMPLLSQPSSEVHLAEAATIDPGETIKPAAGSLTVPKGHDWLTVTVKTEECSDEKTALEVWLLIGGKTPRLLAAMTGGQQLRPVAGTDMESDRIGWKYDLQPCLLDCEFGTVVEPGMEIQTKLATSGKPIQVSIALATHAQSEGI